MAADKAAAVEAARKAEAEAEYVRSLKASLEHQKDELLAECARNAGHLNHRQKIHYVARLKAENDELKQQLSQARALQSQASVANVQVAPGSCAASAVVTPASRAAGRAGGGEEKEN